MQSLAQSQPRIPSRPLDTGPRLDDAIRSSHRVVAIEGLRGYLALWVLVCHAFWASGIETGTLSGLPQLLRQGDLAVRLFIIVSGFANSCVWTGKKSATTST